jgi:mannose-1-phosphate guanylyltransferase/mannose-6-phosphate isomerase
MSLYVLILAGGSGTRLWPLSREEMPKQFLSLCGSERSLLQVTARRLLAVADADHFGIAASGKWRALICHQMAEIGFEGDIVIEEPEGRNTAPAIALGVAHFLRQGAGESDIVLVAPSDHFIQDDAKLADAIQTAVAAASEGLLVTFGIKPTAPETGYGYIKTRASESLWLAVDSFVEKPDAGTARRYVESGVYYWNGGIFCFRISDIIKAYEEHFGECAPIFSASPEQAERCFKLSPKRSIDYAVMERARNIACVPLDAGWSDVGSWDAVYENSAKDKHDNAAIGNVVLHGGHDNLVVGNDRLICAVDLDSMIVVDTPDALFISPRGSSQKLRAVVKELTSSHRDEVVEAPISARAWGTYRVLSKGDRHKIKRIVVAPGKSLSLQYHMHRSEHWVVVKGTARALVREQGEERAAKPRLFHEGESVFVPKGYMHRLENAGKIPLEIIEVQIGEYLGEDDIVRL